EPKSIFGRIEPGNSHELPRLSLMCRSEVVCGFLFYLIRLLFFYSPRRPSSRFCNSRQESLPRTQSVFLQTRGNWVALSCQVPTTGHLCLTNCLFLLLSLQ